MPSLLDLPNELFVETVKNYLLPAMLSESTEYEVVSFLASTRPCEHCRRLAAGCVVCFFPLHGPGSTRVLYGCICSRIARSRGKMLEHRMRGILSTAYVVPYIQSFSVNLAECNMDNAQPVILFIRVLRLLPNLEAITILGVLKTMENIFIALCSRFLPFVSQTFGPWTNAPGDRVHVCSGTYFLPATSHSAQIDTVNNVNPSRSMCECLYLGLRKTTPNLRRIMISVNREFPGFYSQSFEGMSDLSEVRVQWSCDREGKSAHLPYLIESGKKILKTSKAFGRKQLCFEEIDPHQHTVEQVTRFTLTGNEWATVPDYLTQLFD
ncbi:hypothetical protein C8R47DRAFT_1195153 [Mycena vitilis]|nr:hypothetical protein C8R47DRAFT_1195153 [Mycena vitilis]